MFDRAFSNWRAVVAVLVIVVVAITIWLNLSPEHTEVGKVASPAAPPKSTNRLAQLQPLDRAALIEAANHAASDFASGKPIDQTVTNLAGRRFEVMLPFGCGGAEVTDDPLENGWRYDVDSETLQIVFPSSLRSPLAAADDKGEDLASRDSANGGDGEIKRPFSKGFWIERVWMRDASCPVSEPAALIPATAAEPPSLAIVELADADAPRAGARRGEPYRVSKRVAAAQAPDQRGLRIELTGRLAVGDGQPVRCQSTGPDRRPVCIIVAQFDRVTVTDFTNSTIYGEWQN